MARILVIDDDLYIRSACIKIFGKEGWSVTSVDDGSAGLNELKNNPNGFDLVLLDMLMPGVDGMVVLRQILCLNPRLPVIIMTGSVTESSANEIIQQGACNCIPKPFTPDELRAVVRKIIEKR
jgi:DNA-binding NtrC family response regulator